MYSVFFSFFSRARVSGSKVQEDGSRATGNFVVVLSLHEGSFTALYAISEGQGVFVLYVRS